MQSSECVTTCHVFRNAINLKKNLIFFCQNTKIICKNVLLFLHLRKIFDRTKGNSSKRIQPQIDWIGKRKKSFLSGWNTGNSLGTSLDTFCPFLIWMKNFFNSHLSGSTQGPCHEKKYCVLNHFFKKQILASKAGYQVCLLVQQHFDFVTNMTGLLGLNQFFDVILRGIYVCVHNGRFYSAYCFAALWFVHERFIP